jgi:enoyl-[acyl-carrier protein] reductase III
MRFDGKVALVTGSGRGIGRAIALRLASEGADLALNFFRNRRPAEETAEAVRGIGRRAVVFRANVGDLQALEGMFSAVREAYGRLDILVSNAASGYNRPALDQTPKGWDWTMNINARSLLFAAQQAVPLMQGHGGRIIAISSPGAGRVLPEYIVVGASKAALEALVRYLSVELAAHGIVVNAVSPGVVPTEALQHFAMTRDGKIFERLASKTPAGRLVTPDDIAGVVAFLCSPEAEMIRGQVLSVDGGASLLGTSILDAQSDDADGTP